MSNVNKKYIKWGVGTNDVNATSMPTNRTATNYTASDTSVKGHFDGIDTKLGTLTSAGDLSEISFSSANNQSSAANVTGFAFANATVRSFKAIASVYINATSSLYESFELTGIQRGSGWLLQVSSMGDVSGIIFSITSSGQIMYTSTNIAGFSAGTIKFRAHTLSV
jgi:hypothetical protein